MQAVLEREKKHLVRNESRRPDPDNPCDNWLFVCDRCGQPICYDEPLQVHGVNGQVEVAHIRCPQRP